MRAEVGVAFQLLLFLTSRPNMWNITALFYRVSTTSIACIQAQILHSRPNFAIPSRSLPTHRTAPDPYSRFFHGNQLPAIPETFCVLYCRFRTPRAAPSTDSRFATHRISPPMLSLRALVSGLDWGVFVFLCWISFFFRDFSLDCFP